MNIEELLEKEEYKNDPILFFKTLNESDLLLPFNENRIVYLETNENKKYIPLFTSVNHVKELEYTRLDSVKLDIVIRDIFNSNYHAITINPYTFDFIMNRKMIEVYEIYKNK